MIMGRCLREGVDGDIVGAVEALPVKPRVTAIWCRWPDPFPVVKVAQLQAMGVRPVIFWEPTGFSLEDIADGHHVVYLVDFAQDARQAGEVIIRFAHEQNAPWMPWGVPRNDPRDYIAAWRHVARIMRRRAPMARLLWCPDVSNVRSIAPTWPGARFVDLVGLDGYRWPDKPMSPSAIYGPALRAVRALSSAPLVIAEFGIAADYPDAERRRWLLNAARYFRAHATAALYFDIDMRGAGHPDWRLGELGQLWDRLAEGAW